MKACAEKHVLEALALQEQSKQPQTIDVVASALEYLNELDRCPGPKCNVPFEHSGDCNAYGKCTLVTLSFNAGGCAAMFCTSCKVHYCLWCRSIVVAVPGGKHKDDNLATHAHVFDCQKAPHDKSKILTDSVLFPVGNSEFDTSDFLHAFCKIQRLEILALQVQKGLCICIFGVYTCYTLRLANRVCYRLVL